MNTPKQIKIFRRQNVKLKNRQKIIKRFKLCLTVFIAVGLATALAFLGLNRLSALQIQTIEVRGLNQQIKAASLLEGTSAQVGKALFSVSLNQLVDEIKTKQVWVDKVSVSRKLPHTLIVEVELHEPSFILNTGEGYYYVGKKGEIIQKTQEKNLKDYPIFSGYNRPSLEQDPPFTKDLLIRINEMLNAYKKQKVSEQLGVSEIYYDIYKGFYFIPEKKGLKVLVGFDGFETKFKRLNEAADKIIASQQSFASIDLNYEGRVILAL